MFRRPASVVDRKPCCFAPHHQPRSEKKEQLIKPFRTLASLAVALSAAVALTAATASATLTQFDYSGTYDTFTVPITGTYDITAMVHRSLIRFLKHPKETGLLQKIEYQFASAARPML